MAKKPTTKSTKPTVRLSPTPAPKRTQRPRRKRLDIYLDKDVVERFDELAKLSGVSREDVMTTALTSEALRAKKTQTVNVLDPAQVDAALDSAGVDRVINRMLRRPRFVEGGPVRELYKHRCAADFSNMENFSGFPRIPGTNPLAGEDVVGAEPTVENLQKQVETLRAKLADAVTEGAKLGLERDAATASLRTAKLDLARYRGYLDRVNEERTLRGPALSPENAL